MTKKPRQFTLRTLMMFTLKMAVLAALLRFGPVQDFRRAAQQRERDLPHDAAERVIRREQASTPAKTNLQPHLSLRSGRAEWHLVSRCKEFETDTQFLWDLELRGTKESKVVTALDNGGIHNARFLNELAAEYQKLGWRLEVETDAESPTSP